MKTKDGVTLSAAKLLLSVIAAACIFTGCGDDDDDESDGGSNVVNVDVDPNPVARGQGTIVFVDFSYSADDVFDDDRNVLVVVFVPSELSYRTGTSEIDRPIGDDRSVDPQVFPCANGTFLAYDLDEDDLIEAENPNGNADAELKLTLDAVTASSGAIVQASAANDGAVAFTCEGGMVPQAVASVVIQ